MEHDVSKLERELWNRRVQDRSNHSGQGSDSTRHRYWIYLCIVVIVIALVALFFLLKSGDGVSSDNGAGAVGESNSKIVNEIGRESDGLDSQTPEVEIVFDNRKTESTDSKVTVSYDDLMEAMDKE